MSNCEKTKGLQMQQGKDTHDEGCLLTGWLNQWGNVVLNFHNWITTATSIQGHGVLPSLPVTCAS